MRVFDQQAGIDRIAALLEQLEDVLPGDLGVPDAFAGRLLPFADEFAVPEPARRIFQVDLVLLAAIDGSIAVRFPMTAKLDRSLAFLDDRRIHLVRGFSTR